MIFVREFNQLLESFALGGRAAFAMQWLWQHLASLLALLMLWGWVRGQTGMEVLSVLLPEPAAVVLDDYRSFWESLGGDVSSFAVSIVMVTAVLVIAFAQKDVVVVPCGRAPASFWVAAFHIPICGLNFSVIGLPVTCFLLYLLVYYFDVLGLQSEFPPPTGLMAGFVVAFVNILVTAGLLVLTLLLALFGWSFLADSRASNRHADLPTGAATPG